MTWRVTSFHQNDQLARVVEGNNRNLLQETYEAHIYTMWAKCCFLILQSVERILKALKGCNTIVTRCSTIFNLLKSTGYLMHQQFNIQQLYALPTLYLVFCIYLRTNSDLYHLQHKLIDFYDRDKKCLLRGTNWVFN